MICKMGDGKELMVKGYYSKSFGWTIGIWLLIPFIITSEVTQWSEINLVLEKLKESWQIK